MKILIKETNTYKENYSFNIRFFIFILIFFYIFYLLGYNLINYNGKFIITFITYFKLILLYSILCFIIRIFIKYIFYFDFKNTYLIFWKDNLHISIANTRELKKYRHIISILSPIIFLTIVPLILDYNNLYIICLISVNILYSSMDIYNFIVLIFYKKSKFVFNGVTIVKEGQMIKEEKLYINKKLDNFNKEFYLLNRNLFKNYKVKISNKSELKILNK